MKFENLGLCALAMAAVAAPTGVMLRASSAQADEIVKCESHDEKHTTCRVPSGAVKLHRNLSSETCVQGKNWGTGRGEIWVEDGCRAEFLVETSSGGGGRDRDRGRDEDRGAVPGWMIGDFQGYNVRSEALVSMTIRQDGRVDARVKGMKLTGHTDGSKIWVGTSTFLINRSGDGFDTREAADKSNKVHYRRAD